ncbi:MAG: hypothetical protein ACNS61_08480 [Candidatus Wenzhouxiangella sp. M2_3B_020]
MSETMFFGIAVFVFTLLVIGLALTYVEFRHGEPRRQHKRRKRREQRREEA